MTGVVKPRLLALLGIVLLSFGMRSATTSFTPVFELVSADLGLSPVVLGVVGALPPFAFALAGSLTPWLSRRLGAERALVVAIGAIVLGQVARALSGEVLGIVASTALTMVGIGVGNVLLPAFVKRYFPDRVGVLTAVYTTLFAIGGTGPAFVAVPLSDAIGWRPALTVWAVTVLIAVVPWIALARGARTVALELPAAAPVADAGDPVRLRRSPLAWALVLVLSASAMVGYGGAAWLPLILTARAGLDAATAGAHLGIVLLVGIPASLLVPLVASRPHPAAAIVAAAGLLGSAGWAGLLFAPTAAPALWCVLIGCGALTFTLVLVQVVVRAGTTRVAVRLSAFVQTIAYVVTGCTVLALGVLHDATGEWTAPLVVFVAIGMLPLVAVPIVLRPGRVDDPR
ncbi:MFS transporter [Pseudolysinimonas sp.]|jgi:CP family cyanate transporter-like MFS transporter|uniref:MFS transporter n=1 Tax=Pseudolysinimonas sp. TaxID=2680009 RepID=UPI003784833A